MYKRLLVTPAMCLVKDCGKVIWSKAYTCSVFWKEVLTVRVALVYMHIVLYSFIILLRFLEWSLKDQSSALKCKLATIDFDWKRNSGPSCVHHWMFMRSSVVDLQIIYLDVDTVALYLLSRKVLHQYSFFSVHKCIVLIRAQNNVEYI